MKIVFLDRSTLGNDISLDMFNELGEVIIHDTTSPDEILTHIGDAQIVVSNKVVINQETMDKTDLKLICVAATGTNNIDLTHAKKQGITVNNVSGYSTGSVTQLTFSMVLHFMQKLSFYDDYTKNGKWQKSSIFTNLDMPFDELENKRWGIIGLGNIGSNVAKVAESFGCKVSYYSTSGSNFNTDYIRIGLDELLDTSDIITIHCPLNEQTKDLINKSKLLQLKEKVILINVGRGGIINEEDLLEVIDSKELYVGIDSVIKEPIEKSSALLKIINRDRLILTPHIAWASVQARKRLLKGVFNNIKQYVL